MILACLHFSGVSVIALLWYNFDCVAMHGDLRKLRFYKKYLGSSYLKYTSSGGETEKFNNKKIVLVDKTKTQLLFDINFF